MAPRPAQIVILGGTGDLARRKLIPALIELARDREFSVVGVARQDETDESYRRQLAEELPESLRTRFDELAQRIV